jgi:hypothetical protein
LSIARVCHHHHHRRDADDDAMAPTDVARVIPSKTSPDPAKLVKWNDKPTGCLSIAAWVAVAFLLQEFCVTRVSFIFLLQFPYAQLEY